MDATAVVVEPPGEADADPDIPARLGRYVVVEQVGVGGMGRVLRAYDPKLRREVALKVLKAAARGSEGDGRIVREARAMARLSHPNLVPVYDVEQEHDTLFIAMEYVDGGTLRTWLGRTTRSWRDVLGAFVEAGRGLAAAHAAGVVHRDFKPDNAMVGDSPGGGRTTVRVVDFGVARELGDGVEDRSGVHRTSEGLGDLTEEGTVIGTPSYMAPEQHRGGAVSPATDQYAFCVALYEALFRVRPFGGADVRALLRAKLAGTPQDPPPAGRGVPAWLRAAVVRGLAVDAAARWPSMDALLAALERGQGRARARRNLLAAAGLSVVIGVAVLATDLMRRQRTAACEAAGATIHSVWNDGARTGVHDALVATAASYAATTADKVLPWIDAQAAAWARTRTEVCLATDVRGEWDDDTLDRSLWCLDERRMELEALVGELARADANVVQKAVGAAAGLTGVDACSDRASLARLPAPPSDRREDVRAVREQVSRVWGLERAGRLDEALALLDDATAAADALDWPPLSGAARLRRASVLSRRGEYEQAEQVAAAAYFESAAVGAWDVAADAASLSIFVVGDRLARHADGIAWGDHARVALAHAADPEGMREANRLGDLANVHNRAGDYALARTLHEQALAIKERVYGADHPGIATTLNNLALVHYATGEHAEAIVLHQRALAMREEAFGPDHPDVASSVGNLANARYALGELADALALQQRALAITEKALGPNHPKVAANLANVASVREALGDEATAAELHTRALAIFEASLGPEHPDVAAALSNLANLRAALGDTVAARELGARSLAIRERAFGPDHPDVALTLMGMAGVMVMDGDHAQAAGLLERCVAIFDGHPGEQPGELEAQFELAVELVASGGDSRRARSLAEQARDAWRAGGPGQADRLAAAQAWLASLESK